MQLHSTSCVTTTTTNPGDTCLFPASSLADAIAVSDEQNQQDYSAVHRSHRYSGDP